MVALERQRVGPLKLDDARSVDDVGALVSQGRLGETLLSIDEVLRDMPELLIGAPEAARVLHGVPVPLSAISDVETCGNARFQEGQMVRLKDSIGRLLGLGRIPAGGFTRGERQSDPERVVRLIKVFVTSEGQC